MQAIRPRSSSTEGQKRSGGAAMSKAYVEIDFFRMEKVNMASSFRPSTGRAVASSRGIQRFAHRANPQLVRTAMAAGSASQARPADASSPTSSPQASPSGVATPAGQFPRYVNSGATCSGSPAAETTQLTIFYDGAVNTFDGIPRDKAEAILRVAEAAVDGKSAGMTERRSLPDGNEQDDLPIARKKSLLRFLDKRKERLLSASPYHRVERHRPR